MFFQVLRFKRGQRELICQLSYDLASYKWPPLSLNLHKSIRWVNRSVVSLHVLQRTLDRYVLRQYGKYEY